MLRELSIENLAVIEKASIAFDDKLNVFTGETGAGKSILIGGINAILGGRVSKDIVRAGTEKAVVTGLFDDLPESVKAKLSDNGFAVDDELLLQRDIHADGKSTARINGRATTVAILRDIASELIDIHGQHDNRLLMDGDNQREILDSYGKNSGLLSEYATAFKEFSALSRKIKEVSRKKTESLERAELLRERLEELDRYNFSADEEIHFEQDFKKMSEKELRDFKGMLIRDYNDIIRCVQKCRETLAQTLNKIARQEAFQDASYKTPLENMLKVCDNAAKVLRQLNITLESYDSLMKQLEVDISLVETEKKNVTELLEDYVQNIHKNLEKIGRNSTIKIREKSIKMLKVILPVWEDNEKLYSLRLSDLVDEITEEGIRLFENNENAQEYICLLYTSDAADE